MDLETDILSLRKEIAAKEAELTTERAGADKVAADLRASGVNLLTDADAFAKIDGAYKRSDALRDEITELRARQARALEIVGQRADAPKPSIERREAQTIARRFLESAEYRSLVDSGRLTKSAPVGQTNPVEVATRDELIEGLRLRTNITSASGSGGGLIWSDRLSLVVPIPERRVRLLDVVNIGATDTDTVEWVKETTRTHAAAEVAFGTSAPESAYGYTKTSTSTKRIAHWVPSTKAAVADGGQLRTLVDSALRKGLELRIESQILNGDGTGENLTGLLNAAYTISTQARGADTRFDATHKAITKVRIAYEGEPTVIGLHPTDYETLVLEKDSAGNYTNGRGATESGTGTIWGLVPVVSTLFAAGAPVLGDFSQATLWMRDGISLSASDSHASFFIQGMLALLAETRAAFAVTQEKAFAKVTGF